MVLWCLFGRNKSEVFLNYIIKILYKVRTLGIFNNHQFILSNPRKNSNE